MKIYQHREKVHNPHHITTFFCSEHPMFFCIWVGIWVKGVWANENYLSSPWYPKGSLLTLMYLGSKHVDSMQCVCMCVSTYLCVFRSVYVCACTCVYMSAQLCPKNTIF